MWYELRIDLTISYSTTSTVLETPLRISHDSRDHMRLRMCQLRACDEFSLSAVTRQESGAQGVTNSATIL